MMRLVRRRWLRESERFVPELPDHRIDDVEHRLGRPEACGDRKVAEFTRAPSEQIERIVASAQLVRPFSELAARLLEASWVRALETVDRLLEVADHEQCP